MEDSLKGAHRAPLYVLDGQTAYKFEVIIPKEPEVAEAEKSGLPADPTAKGKDSPAMAAEPGPAPPSNSESVRETGRRQRAQKKNAT
jgi:hypothetical protein